MADQDALDLIQQQVGLSTRLRELVERAVRQGWITSVTDLSDESQSRWLELILPLMAGVREQHAAVVAENLAEVVSALTGTAASPLVIPTEIGAGLRGVSDDAVYARPLIEARALIAQGVPGPEAMRRALQRAVTIADTDTEMALQHTAREMMRQDTRIVGYRRVLTGARTCGICAVASTQRYRRGDLMPIHPSCDCGVAPIVGDQDPGRVINDRLLDTLNDAVRERFGSVPDRRDWRSLTVIQEHGEMGPVLARAGDAHMDRAGAIDRG